MNVPNFLRLEWMYAKFKIKVLHNSRLNLGIKNDVFPYNFLHVDSSIHGNLNSLAFELFAFATTWLSTWKKISLV